MKTLEVKGYNSLFTCFFYHDNLLIKADKLKKVQQ